MKTDQSEIEWEIITSDKVGSAVVSLSNISFRTLDDATGQTVAMEEDEVSSLTFHSAVAILGTDFVAYILRSFRRSSPDSGKSFAKEK